MDYTAIKDEHLLKLLQASDEGALREIYLRYWKNLYLTALKKIRCKEVAEELVQNVIVSLWSNRKVTVVRNLEGYLKVAIKYQVINFIKAKLYQDKKSREVMTAEEYEQSLGETGMCAKELSTAIDNAILQLPEKTRQVFNLSRFEEQSVKEIARTMNISEKAVEYHITKSIKILKVHLKDFILFELVFGFFLFS
jgi:RNA polymerase sigma-70 factor (ECF subfamily)